MCNDFFLSSVVETRLILQGLFELLLELGWYLVKVGILRTWSFPINFNCPSAVFGNCPQFGRDHLLRVELYDVEVNFTDMPNPRKWFHVGLEKFCFITDLQAARIRATIAYWWLFPDSHVSIKTLCSEVITSPKFCCSRYGFTCASLA